MIKANSRQINKDEQNVGPKPPKVRLELEAMLAEARSTLAFGEFALTRSNRIPPGVRHRDLQVGTGWQAEAGCWVRVRLHGSLNRGKSFDRDRTTGDIADFRIGRRDVIAGLERGVIGMRVGGRRRLRISPHLAYGVDGVPGVVPANAVLIYDVELLECEMPKPPPNKVLYTEPPTAAD